MQYHVYQRTYTTDRKGKDWTADELDDLTMQLTEDMEIDCGAFDDQAEAEEMFEECKAECSSKYTDDDKVVFDYLTLEEVEEDAYGNIESTINATYVAPVE
jgi:hypothetical protein